MQSLNSLAWRNLKADRPRALLSMLAIALGTAIAIAGSVVAESTRKAILTSDELRSMMEGLLDQVDPIMAFVSVVIMLTAGFLIFNAFAMSVTQRRQQIGAFRSLGMTGKQVLRLLVTEALIVGAIGTAAGVLAGPLMGQGIVALLKRFGGGLFAFETAAPTAFSVALAIGLGMGVTLLAVLIPAWHALRISPLAALREPAAAGVDRNPVRRAFLGMMLIILLALDLMVDPPGSWANYPQNVTLSALLVATWFLALILVFPWLIGTLGQASNQPLSRLMGANGRLIADNFRRGRRRVTLTVLTLTIGLAVITGLTGFMDYMFNTLFMATMQGGVERQVYYLSRIDPSQGWEGIMARDMDTILLTDDELAAIHTLDDNQRVLADIHFVIVPELSFMGSAYFSFVIDPEAVRAFGDGLFSFSEGDWGSAMPLMQSGCGVLMMPLVASRNHVSLHDRFTVSGPSGPVECTVAGIGTTSTGATIISAAAGSAFEIGQPVLTLLMPGPSSDPVEAELAVIQSEFPEVAVTTMSLLVDRQQEGLTLIIGMMNGMLFLAILGAAMGIINTTMMSVSERRRELGLLRAVGSTKRQIGTIIMGEAAMIGALGGLMGFVAGIGFLLIYVVTYGSRSWGIDLPLWSTAFESTRPALLTGFIGLIAAPVISALAAWPPTRQILRERPVESLALQ
jgi:putative ABC transport system permease protein